MREAIHEILTDVSDSFSNMIDMALANEIRVRHGGGGLLLFCIYQPGGSMWLNTDAVSSSS